MFNKEHLKRMTKLNEEYVTATPDRRKEIEQEIINMVPEEVKAKSSIELNDMARIQQRLSEKIIKLTESNSRDEFITYINQLQELDEMICTYAKKLGTTFEKTDYMKKFGEMLKIKFGE